MKRKRSNPVVNESGKCGTASRRVLAMIPPDLWPSTRRLQKQCQDRLTQAGKNAGRSGQPAA